MDPRMKAKGSGSEYNHDGNGGMAPDNQAGVYFHPGAQKFIETAGIMRPDGVRAYAQEDGKIQGDAFVQMGYRPATPEELKEYSARQEETRKAKEAESKKTTTSLSSSNRS